ncbi:hypothetical protein AB9R03_02785 [Neisseria gonorrhoeae]
MRTCSDFRLRGNDDSGITDDSSGRRVGFSPLISPHQGFWGIGVTRRFRFLAKLVGIGGLKHTLQSTLQPILRIRLTHLSFACRYAVIPAQAGI